MCLQLGVAVETTSLRQAPQHLRKCNVRETELKSRGGRDDGDAKEGIKTAKVGCGPGEK